MSGLSKNYQSNEKLNLKAESDILLALCIQRKGQNYNLLRSWDQIRDERLSIHKKTVSQLVEYAETSLQLSTNYLNVVKQFLTDKHDQFIKYNKYSLSKPKINHQNPLESQVYNQSSNLLGRLYDDAKSYQQNALRMSSVIQSLLRKVQDDISESDSEMITLKEEVNSLNQDLMEINDQASVSCGNLSDVFYKQKAGNAFNNKEDFYALEQMFMEIADEQTELQKELGKEAIRFFSWGQKTKAKRQELIKEVLLEYYITHQEVHRYQTNNKLIQQIKNEENKKDECQVEDILDRQSRKDVNRMMGEDDKRLSITDLFGYIQGLQFNRFDPRNLVLKETTLMYKNQAQQKIEKRVIITVDAFIHFLDNKTEYDIETVWTIKLDKSVKTRHVSETELEIVKQQTTGGLIRNLLHLKKETGYVTLALIFDSEDHKQEFCEFIDKMLV